MMQDSTSSAPGPQAQALLEKLQDIHAVAEPSWWPPAPGWWLLAALVLVALVYGLVRLIARLRVHLRRRRLLRELEGLDKTFDPATQPAAYLAALNRLFRAIALRAFPGSDCARLEGEDWVAFIRERLPGDDSTCIEALKSGPYQARPEFNLAKLRDGARRWVAQYG